LMNSSMHFVGVLSLAGLVTKKWPEGATRLVAAEEIRHCLTWTLGGTGEELGWAFAIILVCLGCLQSILPCAHWRS
jgi:hypothetical protein